MPAAGHGKVSPDFLFLCQRKTANLIDNEIHVTAETNLEAHARWHDFDSSKNTCVFFRVLARISVQEGNRGTVISRESILVRINVQEIKRR